MASGIHARVRDPTLEKSVRTQLIPGGRLSPCGRLPSGSNTPGQLPAPRLSSSPAPRPASCRAHGLSRERQAYGTKGSLLLGE